MRTLDTLFGRAAGEVVLSLAEVPMTNRDTVKSAGAVYGKDTSVYTGNIFGGDDPNWELAGRDKFFVYREMRRSDPACRSLEWMFRLPLRAADWQLKPAGDGPEDKVIADCLGYNLGLKVEGNEYRNGLGLLSQTWEQSIAQALFVLTYGCMCEEQIYGKDTVKWVDADGDEHIFRPLTRLAPRMPVTILDVKVDPNTGEVTEVQQDLPDAKTMPGWKIVWYVTDPEDDVYGTSMFRPAFGPWKLKRGLMTGAAIGWDRWASGTPVVRFPKNSPAAEARAEAIGRNIRTHERGWVALESGEDWSIEILNGSGTIADPTPLLQHYDAQIAMAGLQQFSSLGVTQTGSRAVGDVLSKPYYEACQAVANDIASARMKQVFRPWVDYNYGKQYDIPELVCSGIEADDLQTLATILADLSSAGFSFTDAETQNDIRRRIKLPALPEKVQAAIEKLPPGVGLAGNKRAPAGEGGSIAAPPNGNKPAAAAA